jgi:hypothetical protein
MTRRESHLDFFFLPLIYPATPFRAGARHGRFRRTVFQPRTSFWVGHRQLKLSATKPTACFAHTFGLSGRQNRGLGEKKIDFGLWSKNIDFSSLAATSILPPPLAKKQ